MIRDFTVSQPFQILSNISGKHQVFVWMDYIFQSMWLRCAGAKQVESKLLTLIFNDYWAPKKSWVHQENRNPSKVSQYLANQPRQLRMSIISCFHQLENYGRVWKWWNQNCMYLGFFPNWGCLSFWVSISWETLGWLENSNEFPADWDFANTQKPALGRILPLNLNGPKCYLFRCGDLHLITATYNYSPSVTLLLFFFLKENP